MWVWVKSYWFIPLLGIVALFAGLKKGKLEEIMDAADESRKRQNDAIDEAAIEKRHKTEQINKEYASALKATSKIYELQKKDLSAAHKKKLKKITKTYYNDKDKISQEIKNEFGFTYIPSKDNSN